MDDNYDDLTRRLALGSELDFGVHGRYPVLTESHAYFAVLYCVKRSILDDILLRCKVSFKFRTTFTVLKRVEWPQSQISLLLSSRHRIIFETGQPVRAPQVCTASIIVFVLTGSRRKQPPEGH